MDSIVDIQHVSYAYETTVSPGPKGSWSLGAAKGEDSGRTVANKDAAKKEASSNNPNQESSEAKQWSDARGEKWALRDVSFSLSAGEKIAILGANGSGKSTLARLIAGLEAPDAGTVRLFGKICKSDEGLQANAYAQARKKTAMVFQEPADQILGLSVAEDIAFGPENLRFSEEHIQEAVSREVERFGLSGLEEKNPNELSGGQQQKLVLASALAMEPRLLVLDEAAAHLDARARHQLFDELFQYAQTGERALVYITHDLEDALLADRILVLKAGELVAAGSPQALFTSPQTIASWDIAMPPQLALQRELQRRGVSVPFTLNENTLCQSLRNKYLQKGEKTNSSSNVSSSSNAPHTRINALTKTLAPSSQNATVTAPSNNSANSAITVPTSGPQQGSDDSLTGAKSCSPEALSICHLSFSYAETPVLEDVSLSISKGATCALIGETGTGKTTLLRILAGLLPRFEGDVSCDGVSPHEFSRVLKHPRRNRNLSCHVGYVMQAPERQLFAQSVLEDVSYGPHNLGLASDAAQTQAVKTLEALGIAHLAQTSPFELSGGQARLVAIAGIVVMNAPLLLMDEPFAGLDERASNALRSLLASLTVQGHTVLFTTHDMDEAARASRIALLAEKKIQASADPSIFFSDETIRERFHIALPWAMHFSAKLALPEAPIPTTISALADKIAQRVQAQ